MPEKSMTPEALREEIEQEMEPHLHAIRCGQKVLENKRMAVSVALRLVLRERECKHAMNCRCHTYSPKPIRGNRGHFRCVPAAGFHCYNEHNGRRLAYTDPRCTVRETVARCVPLEAEETP